MNSALCPYCSRELASDLAQQCLSCGMDWHDPNNVVRHGKPMDLVARANRTLAGYERGILTAHETVAKIIECATITNSEQIVSLLDSTFRNLLRKQLDASPVSDDDWAAIRQFSIGTYGNAAGFDNSDKGIESPDDRWRSDYRTGVESLRQYFA